MAEFYIKNEAGEFVEADDRVDERFREKSDKIVSERLNKIREKVTTELRERVRAEESEAIKSEVRGEVEKEFQTKFDAVEAEKKELSIKLRRKSIAAEYGFKPEAEKYLGDGTDEEMRKEADNLKKSFEGSKSLKAPEKATTPVSDGFVKLVKD